VTIWRSRIVDASGRADDVLLEAEPTTTVAQLASSLQEHGYRGQRLSLDGRVVTPEQRLDEIGFVNGGEVGLDVPQMATYPGMGTYAVVVAGPDTGKWAAIPPGGSVVVGRAPSCDLALRDSLLSGRHLRIGHSASGAVAAEDLDSTNGTRHEGQPLVGIREIAVNDYLQVGTSILTVLRITEHDLASMSSTDGNSIPFQRRFREAAPPPGLEVRAPREPADVSGGFNASWLRMLAPILGGVGFAVVSGRPQFLIIMVISPLIFLFENHRRKRRQRRDQRDDADKFLAELAAFDTEINARKRTLVARARSKASPGGIAGLYGLMRHRRLWERSPADDDFCSLTIGLSEQPSGIKVQGELPADRPADLGLWGTPLAHSLLTEGPLAVVGNPERARAVARSMLLELATAHSPADLKLWVLTGEDAADEWNCLRWLPHAFLDGYSSRIASTAETRAALVSDLQRAIKNRSEAETGRDRTHLPVHVVLVDGAATIASGDLTDILGRGPAVGVTGITVDEQLVPEGTHGLLKVGSFADLASFSSRTQPRTLDVITFEVTSDQADLVNRRLSGLRPVTSLAGPQGGTVRFSDLADANGLTVDGVLERWAAGPTSRTLVGVDGDVPIRIDVMKDGPHGLVGGTTRSGKTEFLKTFLTGLCLGNHPDDLAIAIIDFKGGVDHEAVAQLPHVIDLSTNSDIASFERTVALLKAELVRRQECFRSVGAPNLDAYRSAVAQDPRLVRVPRLLVVVDEFGELLATETGKESLGQLESITRIGGGLGVHLLLVTQNFENQLPTQIAANAGMRVCFRVQDASHSKIVLGSDAASTIPAARVGRAFLRFHGGELQEFQSARVAGPRPGSVAANVEMHITQVPFGALPVATPLRRIEDPPFEHTDLWDLIQVAQQAAARSGWTAPVVPWPKPLPDRIELEELLEEDRAHTGERRARWVIGRADLPDLQRSEPVVVNGVGDLSLVLGGPSAGLDEVVQTLVVAAALAHDPADLHVYVIDQLGQGFAGLAALPHCGGVATRNDSMARRILQQVGAQLARRRGSMLEQGAADIAELRAITGDALPDILLVVHGADRVLLQGEGAMSPLYAPLLSLASEVRGAGIGIVLSGLPSIAHNRIGASASHRLVFALPSRDEYAALEVDRVLARSLVRPGLGWDSASGRVFQAATLRGADAPFAEVCAALAAGLSEIYPPGTFDGPVAVRDVPWPLPWLHLPLPDAPKELPFPLAGAVTVETGALAWFDGEDDGPVIGVTGTPRSGRSTALLALGRLAKELGYAVVAVPLSRRSPIRNASSDCIDRVATRDELSTFRPSGPTVVLIDDLNRWDGAADELEALLKGSEDVMVAVSGPPDFFGMRNDVTRALGTIRTGFVLAPATSRDGDAFGLRRIPDEVLGDSKAGRGAFVVSGEALVVQVPVPT
jgi:S-DNA-T family DNA segregation ATPase FtsK/SpoIIIE